MAKKYKYNIGDLVVNKVSDRLFCIIDITHFDIIVQDMKKNQKFHMRKYKFKEQLESEEGKEKLEYFPVIK